MAKITLLMISLLFQSLCLGQLNQKLLIAKIDSALNQEIVNYRELKSQLSVSDNSIEVDTVLVIKDSIEVIQFDFGITGYKIRALLERAGENIRPLTFGRSDHVVYFKTGYYKLMHITGNKNTTLKQEAGVADALLPECYKIYIINRDTAFFLRRAFSKLTGNDSVRFDSNGRIGLFASNIIFLNNELKITRRKGKFILQDMPGKNKKEVLKYQYPRVDVIRASVLLRNK